MAENTEVLTEQEKIKEMGIILLRTGLMMQGNGASTSRIRMIINRIANAYGYHAELFVTQQTLNLTVTGKNNHPIFSCLRRTTPPGVNFRIISGISRMSWKIEEQPWTLHEIEAELDRLAALPHYPRLVILSLVSLAGACFCGLADGHIAAMFVTFAATFIGLFIRQEAHKKRFKAYLCVFFAAFSASLFAGAFRKMYPDGEFEPAFATCVLFLIPGVPLINSFTDLLDGNILNGIMRAVNGFLISFMIALGLICSLFIYGL